MPTIKIADFGGLSPSSLPRALPENGAQAATNLFARTREFRPLANDTAVTTVGVSNPATLYRYQSTWLASATHLSFARAQINGDTTERTYYTFNDGSAAPRAINSSSTLTNLASAGRLLGVPAPTAKPAVVLQVTDELTTEELPGVDTEATTAIQAAINAAFVDSYQGNAIAPATPSVSQLGWAPHGAGMPSVAAHQWNLLVPMNGPVPAPGFEYVQRPEFGGMQVLVSGVYYWAVPFELYAPVRTINSSTLSAALTALKQPNDATTALFEPAEVTGVTADIVAYYALTSDPMKSLLDTALAATAMIRSVIDQSEDGIPAAFFTSTTWTDAFNAVVGINTTTEKGSASERIAYEATIRATKNPLTGADESISPTATRYWPETAGTATQYSNIRADINACISTNALGQVEFDAAKLRNTLAVEFEDIIMERAADQRAPLRSGLSTLIDYCLQPLEALFAPENLVALSRQASTDVGSSLLAARDQAKTALNALRNMYTDRVNQVAAAANNAYAIGAQQRIAARAVTRLIDTRFYRYTYVNDWGEESAPSPVSDMVEVDQNDTVQITVAAPPGSRNITHVRIYRSNTGSNTAAFQYLRYYATQTLTDGEWARSGEDTGGMPVGTVVYVDSQTGAELQEICPSTTWDEPPPNLRGLTDMPNGVIAGFFENTVCFCEPFYAYAWPVDYQHTTEHQIVAMASFGQTLVVGTTGYPYFVSGADSASMSAQKLESRQACVSAKSMIRVDGGVVYASPDGLCLASSGGIRVVTEGMFTREDWQKLNPSTMVCAYHDGVVYMMTTGGTASGCYALDIVAGKLVTLSLTASAFYTDLLTDVLYAVNGTAVTSLFTAATYRTATWKSRLQVAPKQAGFAWLTVESDFGAAVTVKWYGDGVLRHTATVSSREPVRLPAGRYLEHELQIEAAVRLNSVTIASSGDELREA